jgi:hypothetical protein
MKVANATKKLAKAGFDVKTAGSRIIAKMGRNVIEATANGGDYADEIATIRVRSVCDTDHIETDYFAGTYCDNISQAIRLAQR